MATWNKRVGAILQRHEPLYASDLKKRLVEEHQCSDEMARKSMSRAAKGMQGIHRLPLHTGHVYYLSEERLHTGIHPIFENHAPPLYRICQAIEANGGHISPHEAAKLYPVRIDPRATDAHEPFEALLRLLKNAHIISRQEEADGLQLWIGSPELFPGTRSSLEERNRYVKRLRLQQIVARDLVTWLEGMGFTRWNAAQVMGGPQEPVLTGGTVWDAYGFSYGRGLARYDGDAKTPRMVPIDVCTTRDCMTGDVRAFIERVQILEGRIRDPRKKHLLMPICLARSYEREAFREAKAAGLLVPRLSMLWGEKVWEVLERIGRMPDDPDMNQIDGLLGQIASIGQLDNLSAVKGHLFEYVVSAIFRGDGYGVQMRQRFPRQGDQRFEFDVVATNAERRKIRVVECKGIAADKNIELGSSNDKDTVKYFFLKTYPAAQRALRDQPAGQYQVSPCFVTSGGFSDEALEWLRDTEARNSRWEGPLYMDRGRLLETLDDFPDTTGGKIVREYFGAE